MQPGPAGKPRFALIGHPVAHSRSPLIHRLFAEQFQISLRYDLIDVDAQGFERAVQGFVESGGRGLNVTVPHKAAAFALADDATSRARSARAANTLRVDDGRLSADNTDGAGLVRDIRDNHGIDLRGARILVLGAGGAVRGCLGPLLETSPSLVHIANRTVARARELVAAFGRLGRVEASGFAGLGETAGRFDLIIHATSAGLGGTMPEVDTRCIGPDTVCYDMFYATSETPFLAWSRQAGAGRLLDGWGMLVEQAAESFLFWHGKRPRTQAVIARLRASQD